MKLHHLKYLKQNISSPFGSLGGFFVLPLLLLPFVGFAQEQAAEPIKQVEKSYKNQIDLDVEILAAGISYNHKIHKKYKIGGIIHLGFPILFPWKKDSEGYDFEVIRMGLMISYQISQKWTYILSPQVVFFLMEVNM